MNKTLGSIRVSRLVFVMCFVAYAAAYMGRISYYTALSGIAADCGKSGAGLIGTAFFFCYGCGQLISGMLGDRSSPFKMIFVGLVLSAGANMAVGLCRSYTMMAVIWGFNGLAQSMLWSPILFIFVHILHPDVREKACLSITGSVVAGTVLTYIVSMVILMFFRWNLIFLFGSAVLAVTAVLWLCVTAYSSKFMVSAGETGKTAASAYKPSEATPGMPALLLMSGGAILAFAVLIHGTLKEGVSVWTPTMIVETYRVTPSFSVFLSVFLPIASLAGPYAIDFIHKRLLGRDETKSAALCLLAAIPPLCVLLFIGELPVATIIVMLALVTAAMNAFNYITVTLVPVRYVPYGRASTATGLLNSVTYLGCAGSTYGFGRLSEQFGWGRTAIFWIGLAALGTIVCLLSFRRWRRFIVLQNIKRDSVLHE